MTPTQLHELDVSIAKAMGKERLLPDMFRDCFLTHKENGGVGYFQPTRNPADAMEVQQWLLTRGHTFFVRAFKHGEGFLFGLVDEELNRETLWAETLPLAICLFAEKIINTSISK